MGQAKDTKSSEKVRAKGGAGQGLQELREGKGPGWGRPRTPKSSEKVRGPRVGQAKDSQELREGKGQGWGRPITPRAQRR